MSLESWKQLYYPIPADEAAKFSPVEIIQHSLTKWRGLRTAARDNHNVWFNEANILVDATTATTGSHLTVTGLTCSLCSKYYDHSADDEVIACRSCPLAQLGASGTDCFTEYRLWRTTHDPEPMIALLERALQTAQTN